jgi:hypothetical protein
MNAAPPVSALSASLTKPAIKPNLAQVACEPALAGVHSNFALVLRSDADGVPPASPAIRMG